MAGERDVQAFDVGPAGEVVVLESSVQQPAEISAVARGGLVRLTRANDAFLKTVALGRVERFQATSKDGTIVDGFLTLPPGHVPGKKGPAILRIHGGPADQFSTGFELEWQVLAAGGYAVIAANPRGSTGRGTAYSRAIWADWGNKDFEDVMAAVDHVVKAGVADPDRLGVGGWSYGGILTDVVITKTARFKAAVAGASMANHLAGYGTDHYQYEWEVELGLPWKNAGPVAAPVAVLRRGEGDDADALPLRRERRQRAAPRHAADVPGRATGGPRRTRSSSSTRTSGTRSRRRATGRTGSRALPRLVRPLPAPDRRRARDGPGPARVPRNDRAVPLCLFHD